MSENNKVVSLTGAKRSVTLRRLPEPTVYPTAERVVYFIRSGDDGPIKIGFAYDVRHRLNNLQCSHPYKLHLIGMIPTDDYAALEAQLHIAFSEERLRGEWFAPSPRLLGYIEQYAMTPAERQWALAQSAMRKMEAKR